MKGKRTGFFDQVRQAVAECGLTQYRLSQDTGIDPATLSRFMRGERSLSAANMERLAVRLGLRVVRETRDVCAGRTPSRAGDSEHGRSRRATTGGRRQGRQSKRG